MVLSDNQALRSSKRALVTHRESTAVEHTRDHMLEELESSKRWGERKDADEGVPERSEDEEPKKQMEGRWVFSEQAFQQALMSFQSRNRVGKGKANARIQ